MKWKASGWAAQRSAHVLALIVVLSIVSAGMALRVDSGVQAAAFTAGDEVVVDTDLLNLRSGAGLSYAVIDVLDEGTGLTIVAGPTASGGYDWYRVTTGGGETGWVAGAYLAYAGGGGFAVGDTAYVATGALNCRSGPGLDQAVTYVMTSGTGVTILDGPVAADGYTWYKVETGDGDVGWAAGEFLAAGSSDGGWAEFDVGDHALVDAPALNCRTGPGLIYPVDHVMVAGEEVDVVDGPVGADGYNWYQLAMENGDIAWAIGEGLALAEDDGDDGGEAPAWVIGDYVVVNTEFLNLRVGAGLSQSVVAVLPGGTVLMISNGPMAADGSFWYEVETAEGGLGWVAASFLAPAPDDEGFAVGDAVRVVDGPLNLRARPSVSASVIRVMNEGDVLLIEGGPVVADGYTWYHVWNFAGEGWAAGEFLEYEPGGFPIEEGA